MQCHPLSTHIKNCNDKINRTENRRHTSKVQTKDTEVNCRAGVRFEAA
jgi:hypothetical protein